jgi:hypothetical protein
VQGVDYAYTLQGWLKGVNSMALDTSIDMGRDGSGTITARDAYGFQLNYFTGDYKAVNTLRNPFPGHSAYIGAAYRPLYNGNISSMGVNIGKLNQPQLYNYEYDQLNRLVSMQAYRGFSGNSWSGITATTDHQEQITYDGNGNITSYLRNGNTSAGKPLAMDNLGYVYNKDGSGNLLNNKLRHVTDAVTAGSYTEDIDGQVADNYSYDQIGNLTGDIKEKIDSIEWNVYGKIAQIWKENSSAVGDLQRIAYRYDASGNRISKTVYSNQDASNYKAVHTWYVRDASGNVMATYTSEDIAAKSTLATGTLGKLYLNELHMYGSSRLGIWNRKVDMDVLPASGGTAPLLGTLGIDTFNRGNKFFELTDHRQNVYVTVSDRKIGIPSASNPSLIGYYQAEIISANDMYPGGMIMSGRTYSQPGSPEYKYSINGQEKTPEIAPNTTTAQFWEYDSRIVRRWNVDPKQKVYESPYLCFSGNPIMYTDPNGDQAGDPKKLHHATNKAETISKKGFNSETHGKYSKYNWFTTTPSNTNPSDASAYGNTTISIEADVSNAQVISKSQTEAWKQEALSEMGYTTNSFNKLAKSNKALWEKVNSEVWGRVYGKVGAFMDKGGANAYFLEKDGTYALSDNFANSSKVTGFSGAGASDLLKKLESTGLNREASAALREWNSAAKTFKWGSRTVAILAVATAGYEIYVAENKPKEITKQVAGFGAGAYCAGICGGAAVETGPGALIVGAIGFAFGYFVGTETTETIWQMTFERGVKAK